MAVINVCSEHFLHLPPLQELWPAATRYYKGDIGVWIFYVLSGYLIGGLLAAEKKKTGAIQLGKFYARRVTRLYPSYICFVVVMLAVGSAALQKADLSWWWLLVPWLDMKGVGIGFLPYHLRTLHIEEKFYLFWGVLAKFLSPKTLIGVTLALFIYGPVARLLVYFPGGPSTLMFDSAADCFAIGILLAYAKEAGWIREAWFNRVFTQWYGRPATLLTAIVVIGCLRTVKPVSYALVPFLPTVVALLSAGLILSGWTKRSFLQCGWMSKVGIMSYTIYLFQQLVLCPWNEIYSWKFTWGRWLVSAALCLSFVMLWFHRVEAPITMWGKQKYTSN